MSDDFELVGQQWHDAKREAEQAIARAAVRPGRDPFKTSGRTCISFSGGRTSAYMLWRVLQSNGGKLPDDVVVCFANTGKEREETLRFVRDCATHWNVPIVWIEYRDDEQGYAVVDFDTASRNGEPFEAIIRKRQYLPNPVTRFCTVELKIRAMHKYLRSLGWHEDEDGWDQMVGIRADEHRRVSKIRARPSPETVKETMIMPLADAGVTKRDVGKFWKLQPFDLALRNNNGVTMEGNCDLCFLKGSNIVFTSIKAEPPRAIWWAKQEKWATENLGECHKTGDGFRFRNDRPSYQKMHDYALNQSDMLMVMGDDESIDCFCGD